MNRFVAKEKTTLLDLLTAAGYSRTKVKQLTRYRAIMVNERPVGRFDQDLQAGDVVTVGNERELQGRIGRCEGLEILYEDDDIIVVDKPAGLLTIASATEKEKTAYYRLTACLNREDRHGRSAARQRVFIVHRLDQGTSGLLVFARNEAAKRSLQDGWLQAEKRYVAVVEGIPLDRTGRLESYLYESSALRVYSKKTDDGTGKHAVTDYKVMRAGNGRALLDITLLTGRKNQIRVHMAEMGHPVVGDKKYGAARDPLGRLALHACFLAFPHPASGNRLEFTLKIPAGFLALLKEKKA
ncbi:MAG: RluA family pseudouridine synthase [Thermodesulfobacteriota bacterium]